MQDSVIGYIKSNTNNQVFYLLTVTNTGTARDSFSFTQLTSGTPLNSFVETIDGATLSRTPGIDPGGSYSFIIRFVVPKGSPAETTNFTNLVATSSICGSSSTDTSHLLTHLYSGKVSTGDSCDVQITKTANSGTVTAGDSLTYTISIINNLPGLANDVFVNDTLPSGVVYGTSTITKVPSSFSYSLSYNSTSRVVQFRALTALQQSQPITFTITVKAVCTAIPSVTNKVLISSSTYDNKASNDTSSVTTNVTTAFSAPVASGITNCYNSTASLTASGAGSGSGYQWYSASFGGSLLYTGQNYTTPVLNSSTTYYVGYYDLDTTTCTGPRTAVTVNVTTAPVITGPSNIAVCPAEPASFTVNATGTSPTYQWQESTNAGSSWANLVNSSVYSGVTSASLTVMPTYSMNGYQYRCRVASSGCSNTIAGSAATLTVRKSYTWLGVNTNWDDPANWCSGVPDSSSDVTIPSGLTYYPHISGIASTHDIYTGSTTTVTLDSGTIRIFGTITNNGLYDARTGTVNMKGSIPQTIAGSMFNSKTIWNLVDGNTSTTGLSVSSTTADTLKIFGTLSFGTDSSKLNTGDNIDLLSTAAATANVGVVHTGNIITGDVIVDRYINTGTATDEHWQTWQFLSTPTRGQTIRQSWMENGNTAPGFGTWITSPVGNAFDGYSYSYAIKYYDALNNNWIGVGSGDDSLYRLKGYMLFVRGDRTLTNSLKPSNSTILRSKGSLLTGTIGPVTATPGYFQSAGNPYASIIDYRKISRGTGVDNKFYAWDPYLYGTYGFGGYQTVAEANDWKPVPGGTAPYNASVANSTIQSGQAFFVYATGVSSFVPQDNSLYFTEDCKVSGNDAVNFSRKSDNPSGAKGFLRVTLYTSSSPTARIADGNAVVFADKYSNKVDKDDAVKMTNSGENFGLLRDGKLLAIEARNFPTASDTLFYYLSNLRQQTYQLRFAPEGLSNMKVQPLLLDNYRNTRTPISLTDTTFVDISFTSDPASKAPARFKVVFRNKEAVVIPSVSLEVNNTSSGVILNWKVMNEKKIDSYQVQFSSNGQDFTTIGQLSADPMKNGTYSWAAGKPVTGSNFYRIRFRSQGPYIGITNSVLLFVPEQRGGLPRISVAPNPASKCSLHFYLTNQPSGIYSVKLFNSGGQRVYAGMIRFSGISGLITFSGVPSLTGVYHAVLTMPNGDTKNFSILY
jgi:uncharacterized repeat protein (TIGR01451 family)